VTLPDAVARRTATREFEASLVVLAGAGTGKTALLVERVVTAVGAGIAGIQEIAAITFTEKAAGDLRERCALGLERLRRLARGDVALDLGEAADRAFVYLTEERSVAAEEIAARALDALAGLDRALVGTIHSFCSEILRAHPFEARLDPGFTVDAGEHFHAAFEEAWDAYLTEELGPRAARPDLWRAVLDRMTAETLREVARSVSSLRVSDAALRSPHRVADPVSLFREEAMRLVRVAEEILAVPGLTDVNEEYFRYVRDSLRVLLERGLPEFCEWFRRDPKRTTRLKRGSSPGKSVRGISRVAFKDAVHASKHLVLDLLNVDEGFVGSVLEAVTPFALELRETLLARGTVGFDALLSLARDLLRDHPEVREDQKRRFRMVLVDELQDTDPVQYEIVLFLAERLGGRATDAYSAELEPGRLFVVGDPKQSIYRFRGADYSAFRRVVDRILAAGGRPLHLTANFRSQARVLRSVNRLFDSGGQTTWVESDVQPHYEPIEVSDPAAPDRGAVEVWTVEVLGAAKAEDRRMAEGSVLAREVWRLVEQEHACRYGEITVLLRAFTTLADYLRPLRAAGIPFVVDGGRDFLKRPEVGHLLWTLRAVALPSDPVALLAFLRAPAGGVPDSELAEYAASGGGWSFLAEPAADRFPALAAAFETLRTLAAEVSDLSPDAAVRRVVDRTSLLPLNAAAFEGPQRVANLRKLVATAASLARDGTLSLLEVVDALQEGRLTEIDADSPLADEGGDAVRVMTIHKAKGLENRVVIMPDLARGSRPGLEAATVRLGCADGKPAVGLRVAGKMNALSALLEQMEQRHEAAEEVRVLYVALTRARERLVLLASPPGRGGSSSWIRALSAWGYDPGNPPADGARLCEGLVLHRLMSCEPHDRPADAGMIEDTDRAVDAYRRARATLLEKSAPHVGVPSSVEEETAPKDTARPARSRAPSRNASRAVGTAVHRWLEAWPGDGAPAATDALRLLARETAGQEGVDADEVEQEVMEIAKSFLGSPLAGKLREAQVLGREIPVLLRRGETAWSGAVDLLYRDPSGTHVVADFKTDREDDERLLAERYREQVGIYREAVQVALGLTAPPRAELWLVRQGKIVTL